VKAAEVLVRLVLDAVPVGVPVLDLYAGAGLFALPLALREQSVTAVEENRVAVADGEASRDLSRIAPDRCRFIAEPVERFLRTPAARQAGSTAAVVLDPPREGCDSSVLDHVFGGIAPGSAVYVSCNPETLARDLARIVAHGYQVSSIQPVDMFPHTPHIETVVVLERRRIRGHAESSVCGSGGRVPADAHAGGRPAGPAPGRVAQYGARRAHRPERTGRRR
jgi:23S rRNA (uracil1939-C5)-methyltransferase